MGLSTIESSTEILINRLALCAGVAAGGMIVVGGLVWLLIDNASWKNHFFNVGAVKGIQDFDNGAVPVITRLPARLDHSLY